jgi:hypothetical protein
VSSYALLRYGWSLFVVADVEAVAAASVVVFASVSEEFRVSRPGKHYNDAWRVAHHLQLQ